MSNDNRFGYKRMMWAILSRLSVTALLLYAADAVHERLTTGVELAVPMLWQRAREEQQSVAAREALRPASQMASAPRAAARPGSGVPGLDATSPAPWRTRVARAQELQKLAELIAANRKRQQGGSDQPE